VSIFVALHHVTHYKYDRPIDLGPQTIRLRPAPHTRTPILSYSLKVTPANHFVNWQQDPQGNWLARFVFPEKATELKVEVDFTAQMTVVNPFDFFVEGYASSFPFQYTSDLKTELAPYLATSDQGPKFAAYLKDIPREADSTVDFLVALNAKLQKKISYVIRMEAGIQTPEETLSCGSGSCRDSAWLLIHIFRHLGLAARFVSGYLIQLRPDIDPVEGPREVESDFTDLHAWAEVYLPGAGWIGFDVTSGMLTGEGHIPVAATPHYRSAAPISGTAGFAEVEFAFDMSVKRILEAPRITRPFSDGSWARLDALGEQVDADLTDGDVRLTMGGEPTFVSIDDLESPEWNIAAVGPTKRALADDLIRKLHARFAPGGLLHYGQGKWYPGETLPRWAFGLYWRKDGVPIWKNAGLIAKIDDKLDSSRAADVDDAQWLMNGIAKRLGLDADFVMPAYEDPVHWLQKEAALPVNVDPSDSKLANAEERARMAREFDRGLTTPRGYVLPVQHADAHASGWMSERWPLRRSHMFLLPGDSPLGLRLPIGSLPHIPEDEYPYIVEQDPMEPRLELAVEDKDKDAVEGGAPPKPPETRARRKPVRTAISVEIRDGVLCVFMPPVEKLEHYLTLIAVVEAVAEEIKTRLHIEGYGPPYDPRVEVIKVTPDPGVIEVNVQPAQNWREAVDITFGLYEDAAKTRLGANRFLVDGRHTGTGGGNHVVVGGNTPEASPFLRRPDLLKSLVLYWQRHPSLSYLFSGMFIGPTSQAPRLD
jgi:transglutaminase-like putative cysteine protease